MSKKTKRILGVIAISLLSLGVVFWPRGNDPVEVSESNPSSDGSVEVESSDDFIVIGGVRRRRPKSDLDSGHKGLDSQGDDFDYGLTPAIAPDANPQVARLAKVIGNREKSSEEYAAAVSALGKIKPFDAEKYQKDAEYRKEYLESPQPARVFHPAQPGEGVPRIVRLSPPLQYVVQGESVKLRVRAVPGTPVNFNSFDLGIFSNQLSTISVEAGADGVAEAEFLARPGTIEDVNVMVASPETSGQVTLVVNVTLPADG